MTIKGVCRIDDQKSLWNGRELYDLYLDAYTPWDWQEKIFLKAKKLNILPFSTPFDESSVDFLEEIGCEIYKIASFENTDYPLLKRVAKTKKPIIISLGAATISQMDKAISVLKNNGCKDITLLKCTSSYPADATASNLNTLPHLKELFSLRVGLSDHTLGIGASIASVALGAQVIEKHFTLSRADGGVDSAFSIEPHELKNLVTESKIAYNALGKIQYGVDLSEKKNVIFKRSIYVSKDIKKGEKFSSDNIRIIRPGDGLSTEFYELLIGKIARNNINKNTPLQWDNIL
jgi:pseudaminic acid synthase